MDVLTLASWSSVATISACSKQVQWPTSSASLSGILKRHRMSYSSQVLHGLSATFDPGKTRRGRGVMSKIKASVATDEAVEEYAKPAESTDDIEQYVALLKTAAKTRKVPPAEVFGAIRAIEKAKINPSNFLETLGGTESPGRTWMLVFTAGKELVRDGLKGGPGGGQYLPVTAVQNFDAAAMRIENGVYLGPIGSLTFEGRISMSQRILAFIFDKVNIKIGPVGPFAINIGRKEDKDRIPGKTDPFFIWFYADDEIIVAKGRGGGVAFWCRCSKVSK